MTSNTYSEDKDKPFDFSDNNRRIVQCWQVCGFEFCFCKYIVGLDPDTGYWIVDDQGELSN